MASARRGSQPQRRIVFSQSTPLKLHGRNGEEDDEHIKSVPKLLPARDNMQNKFAFSTLSQFEGISRSKRHKHRPGYSSMLLLPTRNSLSAAGYCFHHNRTSVALVKVNKQSSHSRFLDRQPAPVTSIPHVNVVPYLNRKQNGVNVVQNQKKNGIESSDQLNGQRGHRPSVKQVRNDISVCSQPFGVSLNVKPKPPPQEALQHLLDRLIEAIDFSSMSSGQGQQESLKNFLLSDKLHASTMNKSILRYISRLEQILESWIDIGSERDINGALSKICDSIQSFLMASAVIIWIVDDQCAYLKAAASTTSAIKGYMCPFGMTIVGKAAKSCTSVFIQQAHAHEDFDHELASCLGFISDSILAVPIMDEKDSVISVIDIMYKVDAPDRIALPIMAEIISLLCRPLLQSHFEQERFKVIEQYSDAFPSIINLFASDSGDEKIMQVLVDTAYKMLEAEHITLFMSDEEDDTQFIIKVSKDAAGTKCSKTQGVVGYVWATGTTINIADAYRDPRFNVAIEHKIGSSTLPMLAIPLMDQKRKVIGVLQAANRVGLARTTFSLDDVSRIERLADAVGALLGKQRLINQMQWAERKAKGVLSLMKVMSQLTKEELPLEASVKASVDCLNQLVDADHICVYTVSETSSNRASVLTKLLKSNSTVPEEVSERIAQSILQTGQGVCIEDVSTDSRFTLPAKISKQSSIRSLICWPVHDLGHNLIAIVIGVYVVKSGPVKSLHVLDFHFFESYCKELSALLLRHVTLSILKKTTDDEELKSMMGRCLSTEESLGQVSSNSGNITPFLWPAIVESSTIALHDLYNFDFDVLEMDPRNLVDLAVRMVQVTGLHSSFQIPLYKVRTFIESIQTNYKPLPFHNFYHGFSVMHVAFVFLKRVDFFCGTKADVLALLISALAHDVDHAGFTNEFMIKSKSELAIRYNDTSVMENHHLYICLKVIRETGILDSLPLEMQTEIRNSITSLILATDMKIHFGFCKQLANLDTSQKKFSVEIPDDRMIAMRIVMKASDLSGQVFVTSIALEWEKRISREFHKQAETEKEMGLEVAPFMQGLNDMPHRAKLQVGFINFVLVPLWKEVTRIWPEMEDCFDRLKANTGHFEQIRDGIIQVESTW